MNYEPKFKEASDIELRAADTTAINSPELKKIYILQIQQPAIMKNVIFSAHAKMRMLQRDLNEETAVEIIRNPEYRLSSFNERKIAVKKMGNKNWHVIYIEEEKIIKVVTVYYE